MLVLGLDTTGPFLSVGLTDGETPLAEITALGARIHSVRLLPVIQDVLTAAGRTRHDLTGIAVANGPGSFTGLRIGMTVAKTLAQVLNLPVVGVSSMDVVAYPLLHGHPGTVLVLLPACRGEVYAAIYQGPSLEPLVTPRNLHVDRLPAFLAAVPTGAVLCVGEAVPLFTGELRDALGERLRVAPPFLNHPRGAVVAALGTSALSRGEGDNPLQLPPSYLRLSAAELVWQARGEDRA